MEVLQTLGKYEVRGTLGRGAMGIVYDGWDPRIERRVAIKAVRLPEHPDPETEDEIARFRREAQAAGRLTHPNIVGVYDYGETADLAYIVMEFVDGTTLKALLDRHERFAMPDIHRIMQDLLAGLQYSHQGGVVHRDIKPANVILTSGGRAKIADFGIARIESSSLTQVGTVMGTPAYMSPEQFMGQVVDERTDIYSSGVLLYQLLTGERPFDGSTTAIMHKVLNTEPPLPSQLANTAPVALDAVVRRTMAKRPEDRFPSAAAFAEALTAAIAAPAVVDGEATMVSAPGGPIVAVPPNAAAPADPPRRPADLSPGRSAERRTRPAIPAIAAGVLGLLVLGGGGWWFAMRPVPPTHLAASLPAGRLSAPRETGSTVIAAPVTTPAQINGTAPAQVTTHAPEQQVARREPPTAPPATTGARPSEVSPGITTEIAPGTASLGVASQPTSEQVAALALGNVRQQIEQALDDARCALVNGVVQDSGTVTVTGMAGREADDALRSQVTDLAAPRAVDWRVQRVDPVFCAALKAIHPVSPMAGARDEGLRLGLAGGISTLRDRDLILPRLTMAKFSGQLRVDYIARDRSLEHMYPRVADPAQKLIAIPAQILRPGQRLEIGNPAPGHPQWDVGPPYGTDMIIAVASSGPLFDSPPARNAEANGSEYLLKLGVAIEAARRNGADVTATVMLVDTTP